MQINRTEVFGGTELFQPLHFAVAKAWDAGQLAGKNAVLQFRFAGQQIADIKQFGAGSRHEAIGGGDYDDAMAALTVPVDPFHTGPAQPRRNELVAELAP